MLATFLSQPVVWGTSILEVLQSLSVVALLGGAYRHIECHQSGCHRIGRFPHGHYKLCHRHHPHVPDDGKITAAHVQQLDA